jgi:hypothetical protein
MSELPEKINELNSSNHKFIVALKEQVNKDLAKVGNFGFETSDFQLNEWITVLASVLNRMNDHELDQFLYVVDLPENWSRHLKQSENPVEQLSEAVLQREWQKIYFRIKFT